MQYIFFENLAQSRRAYNRAMEPVCQRWGLTGTEVDILLFLHSNPGQDRVSDIVAVQGLTKSLVSMSMKHLEELSYLQRTPDMLDRRIAHMNLTEQASHIVRDAQQVQNHYFDAILEGVTQEELALFFNLSQKVRRNLEKL